MVDGGAFDAQKAYKDSLGLGFGGVEACIATDIIPWSLTVRCCDSCIITPNPIRL